MDDVKIKSKQSLWPIKKTVFLIIHGIGQQDPFETLDSFARPFWEALSSRLNPGEKIEGYHKQLDWKDWVENYVSLTKDGNQEKPIDFYEYYWAYKMERQITLAEIYDWLVRTSDGASKYYAENLQKNLQEERKDVKVFTKEGAFKKRGYLKRMGLYLRILLFISKLFSKVFPEGLTRIIYSMLGKAGKVIIDYVGDIAIYTTTDVKSRHYEIRQAVLNGAVQKIIKLLEGGYEQIIIAGHSLGSVVAYDALNRINQQMNVGNVEKNFSSKLVGLVTFGSPLDKIAFFFREHIERNKYIRRQILEHFHSFKAKKSTASYRHPLSNPLSRLLDHIVWVNYWNKNDPISGHLDFYEIPDGNVHLPLNAPWGVSHVKYWDFRPMYDDIERRFLR